MGNTSRHAALRESVLDFARKLQPRFQLSLCSQGIRADIGCIKRFRLLAERYRCRSRCFGLRLNLISGIYNTSLRNCQLCWRDYLSVTPTSVSQTKKPTSTMLELLSLAERGGLSFIA